MCLFCRVQADPWCKVVLLIWLGFFVHSAWAEELNPTQQLHHNSHADALAMHWFHCRSGHIPWHAVCLLRHHKECLQLADRYHMLVAL